MRKIIVIPDSFKGSLSSADFCAAARGAILSVMPDAEVIGVPVADGGEGSAECFLAACGGEKIPLTVSGPFSEPVNAYYARLPDGTAVVETAVCAGLTLAGERKSAADTTTFGVGELIGHALDHGCRKLILCLGGSATNDGGAGMASALGFRFYDADGNAFVPVGRTLSAIKRIDASGAHPLLGKVPIEAMCDVNNPLCGQRGAARVFAPQKGATEEEVDLLDRGLGHFAGIVGEELGKDILDLPGAGAAGGMGWGAVAFLGAELCSGIETVLDTVRFDDLLRDADLVITGEGKLDSQTLGGKVVVGVARRARRRGVVTIAVVGAVGEGAEAICGEGVTGVFPICPGPISLEDAMEHAEENLVRTVTNLMRFFVGTKG